MNRQACHHLSGTWLKGEQIRLGAGGPGMGFGQTETWVAFCAAVPGQPQLRGLWAMLSLQVLYEAVVGVARTFLSLTQLPRTIRKQTSPDNLLCAHH